ncbi:Solute carrier family 22 member 6-B [Schistosoma japonicum]|uniref:Solute carrier family 22 member 6-B n=1 Tax=Schistosoma japonicum TaxID=6182 RepID=A0A4Z2DS68_SCHJA|nr:Solute carrier family 22 member 6-B [Schistosoma japonicum]
MTSDEKKSNVYRLQCNYNSYQQTCQDQQSILQKINIDELYENVVGACGLWQWLTAILIMFSNPSTPTFPVFANSIPIQRCRLSKQVEDMINLNNLSVEQVGVIIGPWKSKDDMNSSQMNGCYQYKLYWTENILQEEINAYIKGSFKPKYKDYPIIPCQDGYVYELNKLQYPGSVVVEFGTVCDRSWLVPLGSSIYFVGMMIGFLFGGWAGDHFGRKKSSIILAIIEFIFSICLSLSPNYIVYILFRAIVAIANVGKVTVLNVLAMEMTIAKYRSYIGAVMALGYNFLLRSLICLEAYFIQNWRWLNLFVMAPNLLCILYFWCLVESPRWLLSKGRRIDALKSLQFAYRVNHFPVAESKKSTNILGEMILLEELHKKEQMQKHTSVIYSDISSTRNTSDSDQIYQDKNGTCCMQFIKSFSMPFSTRQLAKKTILGIALFSGEVMTFFGLLLYARAVRGNVYLVSFINACTSIPAMCMSTMLYRVVHHRKPPLFFVYIVSFIILLSCGLYTYIFNTEGDLVLVVGSNLALIFLGAGLFMLYIYVPELYPSVMRSQGFGTVAGLGRLGTILCTVVNQLDIYIGHGVPLLIYSAVTFMQFILLGIIPDTSGENLPDVMAKTQQNLVNDKGTSGLLFSVSAAVELTRV